MINETEYNKFRESLDASIFNLPSLDIKDEHVKAILEAANNIHETMINAELEMPADQAFQGARSRYCNAIANSMMTFFIEIGISLKKDLLKSLYQTKVSEPYVDAVDKELELKK